MTLPFLNLTLLSTNRPKPYLKPKKVYQWLTDLPTGDIYKSSQLVIQQLKTLNQSRYSLSERNQLLEIIRPTTQQLLLSLKQSLRYAKLPLSDKNLQTAQSIQDLLCEMAHGYKHIVNELMDNNSLNEQDQLVLRESIYLCIQYLARRIVESYLVYTSPQHDIWRELHQLYRYSEYNKIQHLAVDDAYPEFTLPISYTIDLVYKRIVLLSLAAPYHLMQNEVEEIYFLVSAWSSSCQITEMKKDHISDQFGVDFATDMSPRYIPKNMEWEPVDGRIIDISKAKERLNAHITKILRYNMESDDFSNEDSPASLKERQQRDMLLRLTDAWHASLSRETQRQDRGAKLRIALGLNACHFYASNKASFTPEMDELKLATETDKTQSTAYANTYRDALHKDRLHERQNYPVSPWRQQNISRAGLALSCDDSCNNMSIKLGEVVSYLFEGRTGFHWKVGIIRWLHIDEHNKVDMGIMSLANSAVPIAIKAIDGLGKGTDYFRSLLIPKQVSIKQVRSLIVPALLYDIGTVLSVNMKTQLFYVKLTRLIISTGNIAMFEFEVLKHAPVDVSQLL